MMNLLPAARRRGPAARALPRPRGRRRRLRRARRRASRCSRCRTPTTDLPTLKRWFRQFVEVRDAEGAERCLVSAVRAGADRRRAGRHALRRGHRPPLPPDRPRRSTSPTRRSRPSTTPGWEHAEPVLDQPGRAATRVPTAWKSRTPGATRSTWSRSWSTPSRQLPAALEAGREPARRLGGPGRPRAGAAGRGPAGHRGRAARRRCATAARRRRSRGAVAYAAALRIARFHTSNEFGDWDTALHTFTFANAIHQGLRRAPSPELLRGVFDAAMSVYLDRFLNVPAAAPARARRHRRATRTRSWPNCPRCSTGSSRSTRRASWSRATWRPAATAGAAARHARPGCSSARTGTSTRSRRSRPPSGSTGRCRGTPAGTHVLVAAARYLAAHAPTVRAPGQTYQIAHRLFRGERLFEEGIKRRGDGPLPPSPSLRGEGVPP